MKSLFKYFFLVIINLGYAKAQLIHPKTKVIESHQSQGMEVIKI